ncbi:MAG TPA: hypothetical protein VHP83_20355 [Aggregatilineaceae bacterium]|nr:hypothetical protein [Aggregatilineaceae bacterium]
MSHVYPIERAVFTYRLPFHALSLTALVWCVVGGAAVGVGVAVTTAAAGIEQFAFGAAFAAGTAISAALLYGWYWRSGQRRALHLSFEQGRLIIRRPDTSRTIRFRYFDLIALRAAPLLKGCALYLDTESQGEIILVMVAESCALAKLEMFADEVQSYLNGLHPADETPRELVEEFDGPDQQPAE